MTAFALIFLIATTTIIVGLAVAPQHKFDGAFAGLTFLALIFSGAVLALRVLL